MVSAYACGPCASEDAKSLGEVIEGSAGLAGDVVGEPVDHRPGRHAGTACVVVYEDVGEVVPVFDGSSPVCRVGLGEEVAGQPGDAQLDVDVSRRTWCDERAELPVACCEPGPSEVDGAEVVAAVEGDRGLVGNVVEVGEELGFDHLPSCTAVLLPPHTLQIGDEPGGPERGLQAGGVD